MKKAVFLFVGLFLLATTSFGQEAVERQEYAGPFVYGVISVFPGMGQTILGEPKKGGLIFLSSVGSLAIQYGGLCLLIPNATIKSDEPASTKKRKNLLANAGAGLILIGTIGWVVTEVYSISDAVSMAKQKRAEVALVPTVLPVQTATGVSSAAGLSLALRF